MGTELKLVEIAITVGIALVTGAAVFGMMRQSIIGLRNSHTTLKDDTRREIDKLERRVEDMDREQHDTNGQIFGLLNKMNTNLSLIMGKLNVEPVD